MCFVLKKNVSIEFEKHFKSVFLVWTYQGPLTKHLRVYLLPLQS